MAALSQPTDATIHDLRAPITMILGYCDVLLNPTQAIFKGLPTIAREDITRIARNARQMQTLIDQLFADKPSRDSSSLAVSAIGNSDSNNKSLIRDPVNLPETATVLVFYNDPLALNWLQRHIVNTEFIYVRTIIELGRLPLHQRRITLVITEIDEPAIAEITGLVGDHVPVLGCVLPGTRRAVQLANRTHYLSKPVTYQALATLFAMFPSPLESVLIIDDNQDNVEMISRVVLDVAATLHIWKAYSGYEGLALMREQLPSAVILDVRLPDINGLMIARAMQTVSPLSAIPVILVSAQRDSDIPPLIDLMQLSLIRLGGFSPDDMDRLCKVLMA